jgi:hypothetical protein
MGSAAKTTAGTSNEVIARKLRTTIPTLTIDFIFMPPSSKDKGFGL